MAYDKMRELPQTPTNPTNFFVERLPRIPITSRHFKHSPAVKFLRSRSKPFVTF
jgi:hypothetical protein